ENADVVAHDVDAAEPLETTIAQHFEVALPCNVDRDADRLTTGACDERDRLLDTPRVDVAHCHARATSREGARDCAADAAPRAREDRHRAVEVERNRHATATLPSA